MTLYMHYKNKPYKYIGIARHSEALEDVVVYECRYPNDVSKLWVRPRKMFEEIVDGKARFAKVNLEIERVNEMSRELFEELQPVHRACFESWTDKDENHFRNRALERDRPLLVVGRIDGKIVGYKFGYRFSNEIFNSQLGGVRPEYRDLGIARDLITAQHEWARGIGFKKIATKSHNAFKGMLILNLQMGFKVVGTEMDRERGLMVLLEKDL